MRPDDIAKFRVPDTPTISPDGTDMVFSLNHLELSPDEYRSQLWTVPANGSAEPRRLTHGPADADPAYSPDGRWLAFCRTVEGGVPQLWVMPTGGGEPRCLTDATLGVSSPLWSPDSKYIAFRSRVPEPGRYGTAEGVTPDREPPRRVTSFTYRANGTGFVVDRPAHVFVIDPHTEGSAPVQVTAGSFDHGRAAFSPDSQRLVFVAARHDGAGDDLRVDVWTCATDGTDLRALTSGGLRARTALFTPDGRNVCFVALDLAQVDGEAPSLRSYSVWIVPADGSGAPSELTDPADTHVLRWAAEPIATVADGVVYANENRGAVDLVLAPYDGGPARTLVGGRRQAYGFTVTRDLTAVVAAVGSDTCPGEIVVREADGTERTLTGFADSLRDVRLAPMEEVTATAPDGYPVHGWIVRPAGSGPHPVVLLVHGGPHTQYGWELFDEAQVYAGAGYAVVMGNPRGSSGYGRAHGQAGARDFCTASVAPDLLALLDAALLDSDLDGDRVGVMGGSYGGTMTAWLAAHHGGRFRTAVTERGMYAFDSFAATSDHGWCIVNDLDASRWPECSPLTYAGNIGIPTLIIHSEQDLVCPLEQAQRLFFALKRAGTAVELIIFPGEGHELSRSGLPSHRISRFEVILDWLARHL
ncbi:S9 family peptidase [Virgisporangium aurantiacum]|uniref:Dipeptidyl aminopeptidase n=1 Tax=Virgisporangium aurantiacum TaxID=175570 RepID=A0A8J4E660_9ACTN|nr:S9 family peptidase [Virgisporangium aurantiacum]GIJ62818.1 dipeptidyl aminopeptidase [Virgisporangium aurantiacum]